MGQINIRKNVLADGTETYTVYIVGTQDVNPGSENPFNSASAGSAGFAADTDVTLAVKEAMASAGIGPDDPVMLVGHSLGALTAADLAADPSFRDAYNIQSVVAAGATINGRDIPPPTSVLEIVNPYDPVVEGTKLVGGPNRMAGRENYFRHEVGGVPGSFGLVFAAMLNPMLGPLGQLAIAAMMPRFLELHHLDTYEDAVSGWVGGAAGSRWGDLHSGFLCGDDVVSSSVIEFDVARRG